MYKEAVLSLKGDDRYEGFAVDLIAELAKELKFNYTFIVQGDTNYGQKGKNGSWDGLIGRLLREVIMNELFVMYT